MGQPIRVLHIFNWFNQGGIENFVMNVYRNIDRENIQFDFAFLDGRRGYFDDEAISLGAHIYHYDNDKNTLQNHCKSLCRIIKENGPYAAVHSHIYFFSGYTLWIAKKMGVEIRLSHSHETKKGRRETLARKTYESFMRRMIHMNATHMLGCSDAAGKALFGDGVNYKVLYNGIDLNRFSFNRNNRDLLREKLGLSNKKIILNVGRFADQKNHDFIVDIFEKVCEDEPNAVLMLIGTGPLQDAVEKKLKSKQLFDKTIILSNIKDTENYYNAADAFILPSKYEGMSIVSVEAQATGLPALISNEVTREIAVTDIVEYLPITDPSVWADRIINVLSKKYDRTVYNAQFENTPFNIKQTVSDLENIYLGYK